ncbi:MAG: hypothetical protein Q9219_004494, partial [cf. Caloplaca sp. 3 TL-2023]
MATGYSSKDLVMSEIPELRQSSERTVSGSQSNQMFTGYMDKWTDFEKEVRDRFVGQQWPQHALIWEESNTHLSIFSEQLMVANEKGVAGRFLQQVGHIMTGVGLDTGMRLRFGDWYKPHERFLPDITIWDDQNVSRVAGEVKTPWTINLGAIMNYEDQDLGTFRQAFTHTAGQIANYMKKHEYKYGFLTNYESTIFFKQESYTFQEPMAAANGE